MESYSSCYLVCDFSPSAVFGKCRAYCWVELWSTLMGEYSLFIYQFCCWRAFGCCPVWASRVSAAGFRLVRDLWWTHAASIGCVFPYAGHRARACATTVVNPAFQDVVLVSTPSSGGWNFWSFLAGLSWSSLLWSMCGSCPREEWDTHLPLAPGCHACPILLVISVSTQTGAE